MFTAARASVLAGENEVVPWEVILLDTSGGFSADKSIFTVPETGFYLTHFSAGIPPNTPMTVTLAGDTNSASPNIIMTYNEYDGEMMTSRDDIQWWSKGQEVFLSSNYTLYSDGMSSTSWSAVRIDNIMKPVVAFCLTRTYDTNDYNSVLQFTNVMLSVGNALGVCTHQFVAPTQGTYFISFSVGFEEDYNGIQSNVNAYLQVNSDTNTLLQLRSYYASNEKDMSSNSVLISLSEGDIVDVYYSSYSSDAHYSDEHYQTSLSGFLYEPVHGYNIAWNVATYCYGCSYIGPITAFPFDYVMLNDGGVWNPGSFVGTIAVSGIYWLKLTAMRSYSSNSKLDMILTVNSQPIFNVMEKSTNAIGNVRSHSLAVRLKQNDQLHASVPQGYTVYTELRCTAFAGFLIYPDV